MALSLWSNSPGTPQALLAPGYHGKVPFRFFSSAMSPATLQSLPKQTIDIILEYCYTLSTWGFNPKFYHAYRFFHDLSHLCHSLRVSALPYLRRRVVFERYNARLEYERQMASDEVAAAKKLSPVVKWRTNFGRVHAEGLIDQVTEVAIGSYHKYMTAGSLLKALKGYGFDQHQWTSVRTLNIQFGSSHDDTFEETDETGWSLDESFVALGDYLAASLPAIDKVIGEERQRHRTAPRNALSSYLSKQLDRLQRLTMEFTYMPDFGAKTFPPQITHLDLKVFSTFDYLDIPRIMAPTLISLKLHQIPLYYLWDRFYDNRAGALAKAIEFKELRKLDLYFHHPSRTVPAGKSEEDFARERLCRERGIETHEENYNGNPKLKTISVTEKSPKYTVLKTDGKRPLFPKLQTLHLRSYPGRVSEFLKHVPQGQIEDLYISGQLVAFKGLHLGGFRALRRCDISQYTEHGVGGLPHKNRLLARVFSQMDMLEKLYICSESKYQLKLPPMEDVLCTGLRRLTVSGPIQFSEFPELLRKLKRLEYFKFERVKYSQPASGYYDPVGMATDLLSDTRPISTSLVTIVPDILSMAAPDDVLVYNMVALIARIPSLKNFRVFDYFSETFIQAIQPMLEIPSLRPALEL
ncbi:hypothetical protein GQ54DRAFT_341021 [Martensiomyces pterosporus]|nr:hypothetical protein GQ54DRAFT_341021 [Martensiomyces pterosporus]